MKGKLHVSWILITRKMGTNLNELGETLFRLFPWLRTQDGIYPLGNESIARGPGKLGCGKKGAGGERIINAVPGRLRINTESGRRQRDPQDTCRTLTEKKKW